MERVLGLNQSLVDSFARQQATPDSSSHSLDLPAAATSPSKLTPGPPACPCACLVQSHCWRIRHGRTRRIYSCAPCIGLAAVTSSPNTSSHSQVGLSCSTLLQFLSNVVLISDFNPNNDGHGSICVLGPVSEQLSLSGDINSACNSSIDFVAQTIMRGSIKWSAFCCMNVCMACDSSMCAIPTGAVAQSVRCLLQINSTPSNAFLSSPLLSEPCLP